MRRKGEQPRHIKTPLGPEQLGQMTKLQALRRLGVSGLKASAAAAFATFKVPRATRLSPGFPLKVMSPGRDNNEVTISLRVTWLLGMTVWQQLSEDRCF